jgi:hypothetical protein
MQSGADSERVRERTFRSRFVLLIGQLSNPQFGHSVARLFTRTGLLESARATD